MINKKFNYIDWIIIIILFTIIFFAYKNFYKNKTGPLSVKEKVLITFYTNKSPDYSLENIKVGDKVSDENGNIKFGSVSDNLKISDSIDSAETSDGEYKLSSVPGFKSAEINVITEGNIGDYGFTINNQVYGIGHSMKIRVGLSTIEVRIKDIKRID